MKTKSGAINFVVNTLAHWGNGSAYNPEFATVPLTTGQLYDNSYVRHWDVYIAPERYAIFGGVLTSGYGGLQFDGEVKNLLWGINATITRPETPVQPFGDAGDYDISPDGIKVAFLTKAPELPKANYTASYIYVVPHDGSEVAVAVNGPGSTAPKAAQGASESPRWSPDGTKLAYAQQDGIFYESDRFKLYIATIDGFSSEVAQIAENWDSSPSGLTWSHDGKDLYVVSERYAASSLFVIPSDADASFQPSNFTGPETSVADYSVLKDGSVIVSASASWTSRIIYTQTPGEDKKIVFTANEVDPELAGLKPDSVSNFWYEGGDGSQIQNFIYYPTNFDPSKKYPLAFIIHGGPQSSLGDVWSSRWNVRLWADQGFVVTVPQFTGTPSYGQNFTDAIQNNWGGTPYEDIVKLWEYLEANVTYVDTDRAICAGASFGGYMTNWIQGHDLGNKFKALVTHDGKVTQISSYGTDEIFFIQRDNNGTIWNDRENYEKWDPLRFAANFSTPHFIVHNDGDYRVPITEGLANFNILQGLGVPSRFLHFPEENHWTVNRENSIVWHNNIFNWIRYYTGLDEDLIQDIVIKQ